MGKRRNTKELEEVKEEIIRLREKGLTYKEIGERINLSRQRIHQIFKNYNSHKASIEKGVKALEELFGLYEE